MKNLRFILTVSILLTAAVINHYFSKPDISLPRKSLADYPRKLGEWTAVRDHEIDDQSMKILQVDDYLMRDYRNSHGETIGLYIGYFKSQREGKGIHSPRQCLPGAGWVPLYTSVYKMPSPCNNYEISPINKFVMGKGLDRQLYLFWYQGRGRIYSSEYSNKIYLIWDGLTKRRTDGALVRIHNTINGDVSETFKVQSEFTKLCLLILDEYIPR